jgi:hypothetical protein
MDKYAIYITLVNKYLFYKQIYFIWIFKEFVDYMQGMSYTQYCSIAHNVGEMVMELLTMQCISCIVPFNISNVVCHTMYCLCCAIQHTSHGVPRENQYKLRIIPFHFVLNYIGNIYWSHVVKLQWHMCMELVGPTSKSFSVLTL